MKKTRALPMESMLSASSIYQQRVFTFQVSSSKKDSFSEKTRNVEIGNFYNDKFF